MMPPLEFTVESGQWSNNYEIRTMLSTAMETFGRIWKHPFNSNTETSRGQLSKQTEATVMKIRKGLRRPLLLLSHFSRIRLCADPRDGSPPGSHTPGILQARTLEWVAISFSNAWKWKVKVKSLSRIFVTPCPAAYQAPLSMGFSRQEYWSGVPSPSPTKAPKWWQIHLHCSFIRNLSNITKEEVSVQLQPASIFWYILIHDMAEDYTCLTALKIWVQPCSRTH